LLAIQQTLLARSQKREAWGKTSSSSGLLLCLYAPWRKFNQYSNFRTQFGSILLMGLIAIFYEGEGDSRSDSTMGFNSSRKRVAPIR
jgi:hypothetical protein